MVVLTCFYTAAVILCEWVSWSFIWLICNFLINQSVASSLVALFRQRRDKPEGERDTHKQKLYTCVYVSSPFLFIPLWICSKKVGRRIKGKWYPVKCCMYCMSIKTSASWFVWEGNQILTLLSKTFYSGLIIFNSPYWCWSLSWCSSCSGFMIITVCFIF